MTLGANYVATGRMLSSVMRMALFMLRGVDNGEPIFSANFLENSTNHIPWDIWKSLKFAN